MAKSFSKKKKPLRFQKTLDSSECFQFLTETILILNEREEIIYANPPFKNMIPGVRINFKPDKATPYQEYFKLDQQYADAIDECLEKNKSLTFREVTGRTRDHTNFWITLSLTPLVDENDNACGVLCSIQDKTDETVVQDKFKGNIERLEKALADKGEFIASMSHELRTPMNGIIATTDLVFDTELNSEQLDYLDIIKQSSHNLLRIINDILDVSKIESGKMDLENIAFDLGSCIDDTVSLYSAKSAEKKVELIVNYTPNTSRYLIGDPGRIRQMITNYINNAFKFTNSGHICVSAEELESQNHKKRIKISVSDTGIGIKEEHIEKIFKKFEQADQSTTRKYGGTGLGLTIVQDLAKLMNGQVGVDSVYNEGSSFWFTIELDLQSNIPEKVDIHGLEACTLLLIDENKVALTSLANQFNGRNIKTIQVNSSDAFEILLDNDKRQDIQMVIMNNQVYLSHVKEWKSIIDNPYVKTNIPFTLLATHGKKGDAKQYEAAGFSCYLVKPIATDNLVETMALTHEKFKEKSISSIVTRYNIKENQKIEEPKPVAKETEKKNLDYEGIKVLVAEDNLINQKVIRKTLMKFGFEVEIVKNGELAVQACDDGGEYDFILMDFHMPVMNGIEATRRIRERDTETKRTRIPIVALTADARGEILNECFSAGMDFFLSKPIARDQLVETIEKIMSEKAETSSKQSQSS